MLSNQNNRCLGEYHCVHLMLRYDYNDDRRDHKVILATNQDNEYSRGVRRKVVVVVVVVCVCVCVGGGGGVGLFLVRNL